MKEDKLEKIKENIGADHPEIKIGEKLVDILNSLLKQGDWESSLFLKTVKRRIQDIIDDTQELIQDEAPGDASFLLHDKFKQLLPVGYVRVYVLLYQMESDKLANWQYAVKTLLSHNVSRPTYGNESHIQELIRSKKDIEHYGYVVLNVAEKNIYAQELDTAPKDALGHEMLVLKEDAIQVENIIGFIHANKRRYSLIEGELGYQENID